MQDEHLKRIREDLETVEKATGLKPTFHPSEIWLNFACIPTGLMAILWALLVPHTLPHWGLMPTLILCLGYCLLTGREGASQVPEKTRRETYLLTFVAIAMALLFVFWAIHQHLSRLTIISLTTMAIGGMIVTLSISYPRRLYQLGAGVPFLLAGFVMPFWGVPWTVPFGLAVSAAGGALAMLQLRQLRMVETLHQPLS